MPSKKLTANQIRRNIATAKPAPAQGKSIGENLKFSLDRVLRIPDTRGTGTLRS
jgi:hypothetical protein